MTILFLLTALTKRIATQRAIVIINSFTKGKKQLSAKEVSGSRTIANVRIHVVKIKACKKTCEILTNIIPTLQGDLFNDVKRGVCGFADQKENLKLISFSLKHILFMKIRILNNKDFSVTIQESRLFAVCFFDIGNVCLNISAGPYG